MRQEGIDAVGQEYIDAVRQADIDGMRQGDIDGVRQGPTKNKETNSESEIVGETG